MRRMHKNRPSWAVVAVVALTLVPGACSDSADTVDSLEVGGGSGNDLGATAYAANCASCHGADLRGTDRGPSHLSIVYEPGHHGDDAFRSAIVNGSRQHHWPFGDMPPVEGLSSEEVEAIIAFVRSEQERQGFER